MTTHYPELKEWASATDGVANAATGFDPETHAPLYRLALGRPGTSHALQIAERLGLDADVVEDARARIEPERLRTAELLAEAEAAERQRGRGARRGRARARARPSGSRSARASARPSSRPRSRRCARRRRRRARRRCAQAERDLAEARAELEALRKEIRAARRRERERRVRRRPRPRASATAGSARRPSAAAGPSRRCARCARVPTTAPLAVGDPVEAPDAGVRGTIASIEGDTAEVLGPGGLRLRIPLARLRPSASRPEPEAPPEPAVRVFAAARGDVSDQLDVRGMRAQEAREAVRAFVDDAALAGPEDACASSTAAAPARCARPSARSSPATRSSSATRSDSADGASVAHLG